MMKCPSIDNLQFDEKSLEAIDDIRRKIKMANAGTALTGVGVMQNVFYRNNTLVASYNVYQTDWSFVINSMSSWEKILKNRVEQIASIQALEHHNEPKQRKFWEAVANGCKLP